MMRYSRQITSAVILGLGFCLAQTSWAAGNEDTGAQSSEVLITDFRGRPPFRRERVSMEEAAELARFEEIVARPADGKVRVVSYRGRPPFRREIVSAEEFADLARFEETAESSQSRRTRRGPPGKPNPVR